jgi:protein-S-isoprenylcysteine O-methyltransferase Ste14
VFRLLVFAQVTLIALLLFASQPANHSWNFWLVKMSGVAFGLWAIITMGRHINISPELKESAPLRTNGPYRFVRHPMYLALLVFCAAYLLGNFSFYTLLLWLTLLLILGIKVHYEERILKSRFPDYLAYAQKTKRIIPFLF